MSDDEFRALASTIKRRIWGIRTARISDDHRDFYWTTKPSIGARILDRLPFIKVAGIFAFSAIITVIIALVFIAL